MSKKIVLNDFESLRVLKDPTIKAGLSQKKETKHAKTHGKRRKRVQS